MFEARIYSQRRLQLCKNIESGLLVFPGNRECPMNYPANTLPFRQDSSFLYFFGLDSPGRGGIIDTESGESMLFGDDVDMEDIIWMGSHPLLEELAHEVGVDRAYPYKKFGEMIRNADQKGKTVHYLPPYRAATVLEMSEYLGKSAGEIRKGASEDLIRAVVALREIKIAEEVNEIEKALAVSARMYQEGMKLALEGIMEKEMVGKMEGIAIAAGGLTAFPTILTINGQILHNHFHGNVLEKGRLIVIDSGTESEMHYASDITRTIPVGGRFSSRQKEVYNIVLEAQIEAIQSIKPGILFRDIHLQACLSMAKGLKDIGLMKGNSEDAVSSGAHALFFPHGLGHMMGLDVHDMEGLGENYVGYDETVKRSEQFGLAYLRMAKNLKPGHVMTVEPGLYFIPALIERWQAEEKHKEFIDYERVGDYLDFGGIRIEDDVLVTDSGYRILGKPIPKKTDEVEKAILG